MKVINLYAGAGGLALGFEMAGLEHELLVDNDRDSISTLKRNRPQWNAVYKDIQDVDYTGYHPDIVVAGLRCETFTHTSREVCIEDTKQTQFYEYIRCLQQTKPKICMIENIQGLLHDDRGRTINTILEILSDELGYRTQYRILNAVNYGVAQKRKRVFIVGTKKGIKFKYPQKNRKQIVLRDVLKDVPPSDAVQYSDEKKRVLEQVPPGGCWVDLPEEVQIEYLSRSRKTKGGKRGTARRLSWDEPCLTLTTQPSRKLMERCHPDEVRPLTVREYARIQSFPDSWQFCGSTTSKYKQIGKAVPVKLAYKLGLEFIKALENRKTVTVQTTLY
ncbi:MAG: DNA (cytosine-5-)-methyltransferase [Methanosphaera sp. rholeuAM74]|nr:MAG: DNA (cytosine-5-)-methyltransferase [Methanosphaera sp. rholeuAM74]